MADDFAKLPSVGTDTDLPAHPTEWCDAPIKWWPPFAEISVALRCGLGRGHTNDHVALFGSDDHKPPCTVEVRW